MTFQLFQNGLGDWYFRLVASNGQIVAQSEGYKNKEDCYQTVMSIRANAHAADIKVI